jgi:hypothetical protein
MLTLLLRDLTSEQIDALRRRAEALLAEYVAADGSVSVPGVARILVATA